MLLLASVTFLFLQQKKDLQVVDPTTKVKLTFERDGKMDPKLWGFEDSPTVKTLSAEQIKRAQAAIQKFLAKYPPGFLRKFLDRIYICSDLKVGVVDYAGTYGERVLFITYDEEYGKTAVQEFEATFHHEFSSLLLNARSRLFPDAAWRAANAPGFHYRGYGNVYEEHGLDDAYDQKPEWLEEGFLIGYCRTSVEEDFNVLVEGIFGTTDDFWTTISEHPRIAKKVTLAMKFYSQLDPWFTSKRFRAFGKQAGTN